MAIELTSVITHITLDLATANNFNFAKAVQGDNNTRYLYVTLLDDGIPYDLNSESIVIRGTKPDGTSVFNYCSVYNNEIIVELSYQMLAVAGIGNYEIALYGQAQIGRTTNSLTTFPFRIVVTESSFNAETITSTNDFQAIAEVMGTAEILKENLDIIQEAKNSALQSKESATASANSAKNSENNAASSADSAKSSESNAKSYADKAQSYAVGGTNTRTGEDTDNAKYYCQESNSNARIAEENATISTTKASEATVSAANALNSANSAREYAVGSINSSKYYFEQTKTIFDSMSGVDFTYSNTEPITQKTGDYWCLDY